MEFKMKPITRLLTAAALLAMGLISACTIDSADEFYRDVSVNFSGFYTNPKSDKIVANNSGASITSLDLRQSGDSLEAVDNNGNIWRGNLGEVQNGTSSFELNGKTSSGTEATFSGNISSSDGGSSGTVNNVTGTMQGTYIEPNRFSTFYATATIPGSSGGDDGGSGGGSLSISPSTPQTITAASGQITFTASGGSGSYTWSRSSSTLGNLNSSSGSSVTYTRSATAVGTQTITLNDGSNTRTVDITQSN
jgi:hypothetical protein